VLAREEVTTLTALLERTARVRADEIAFVHGERSTSFAGFVRRCERTARWLGTQGIGPGDRVAVWMPNRVEWLVLHFALARRGAALVAVNTRYRAAEVQHLLGLSRARMLVTQLDFRGIDFPGIVAGLDGTRLESLERVAIVDAGPGSPATLLGKPVVVVDADEPAKIPGASEASAPLPDLGGPELVSTMFTTSGTTKGPKLVVHPQRTIALHVQRCAQAFGLDRDGARHCAVMPFCGTYGLMAVLAAFAGGAPSVIVDHFDAAGIATLLRAERITHAFVTDDMLRRLADAIPGDRPFPDARLFGFAAFSPGANELAAALWSRGLPLYGLYGSSEVGALFAVQPDDLPLEQRIAGGGRPASPDAEVRIRDIETGELLPAGSSGEIELRAPTNFTGYFENPRATAEAVLPDGFFRTGDVGHLRPDGTFVYESRRDDSIRLSGFLVSPVEIEDPIKTLPGVADVQVVAVKIGERLRAVAFVIPAPGAAPDPQALLEGAAGLMAPYRAPARVWLVDDFPRTQGANGTKIQRGKLREMALDRLAAEH
jgi:fatty-acyl-CoA synthase